MSGLLLHTSFRQQAMAALQQLAHMLHTSQATQALVSVCHPAKECVAITDLLDIGALVSVGILVGPVD